jgi:hypothetical protein
VGVEVAVIVEETGKVLATWARDAVHAQASEIMKRLTKVLPSGRRDAIAAGRSRRALRDRRRRKQS